LKKWGAMTVELDNQSEEQSMKDKDWQIRPRETHYRIGVGRFQRPILLLILAEVIILAMSIVLDSMAIFGVGIALLLAGYLLWFRHKRLQDLQTNLEGVRLLGAGEFSSAIAIFDQLCKRPHQGASLIIFVLNRATAALCKGDFEFALSLYHEVLRSETGLGRGIFKVQGDVMRARCADALACYGRLEDAEALLAIQKTHDPNILNGIQILARAVIALRKGDPNHALDVLNAHWATAETVYSATELKVVMIVKALAFHAKTGEGINLSDSLMDSLTLHDVQRNRWVDTHWPEMAVFRQNLEQQLAT